MKNLNDFINESVIKYKVVNKERDKKEHIQSNLMNTLPEALKFIWRKMITDKGLDLESGYRISSYEIKTALVRSNLTPSNENIKKLQDAIWKFMTELGKISFKWEDDGGKVR